MRTVILSLMMLLGVMIPLAAQQPSVEVTVSPTPVIIGELATITFTVEGGALAARPTFPAVKGIVWQPQYTQTQSMNVNGMTSYGQGFGMMVEAPGEYTVPSMRVQVGKTVVATRPVVFRAVNRGSGLTRADGTPLPASELVSAVAELPANRSQWYVGERVPFTVIYYLHGHAPLFVDRYPVIAENPGFAIRKFTHPQTGAVSDFHSATEGTAVQRGTEPYRPIVFQGILRPLRPGTVTDGTVTGVVLQQLPQNRSNDPFSMFARPANKELPVRATLPPMKVLPVPDAPKEAVNLGLIGQYKLLFEVSKPPYRTGDPITLDLSIPDASNEGIRTDPLHADGFRFFPPEVSQEKLPDGRSGVRMRYVMVPLRAGELPLNLSFAVFDPLSGKYQLTPYSDTFRIDENPYATKTSYTPPVDGAPRDEQGVPLSDLHYLKVPGADGEVTLPLWRMKLNLALALFGIGFLVWFIGELILWHRRHGDHSSDAIRRRAAIRGRSLILKALKHADDEALAGDTGRRLVDWLADMKSLPSGSTPGDIANACSSPELAEFLRTLETATYRPGATKGLSAYRDAICKVIKRGMFILVAFLAVIIPSSLDAATTSDSESPVDLRTLYDRGEFAAALKGHIELLKSDTVADPALLYNIGNICYQMQRYPEALLCFERARRLAPDDSDILNNLNAACRKLDLPERGTIDNPVQLLAAWRDSFRPDTWLFIAFTALGVCFIALAGFRFGRRLTGLWGMGLAGALCVVALTMFVWQQQSLYRTDEAIVLRERSPVWMLPQADAARQRATLNAGSTVEVREERLGWTLIRYHGGEGWVRANAVAPIWTGKYQSLFQGL